MNGTLQELKEKAAAQAAHVTAAHAAYDAANKAANSTFEELQEMDNESLAFVLSRVLVASLGLPLPRYKARHTPSQIETVCPVYFKKKLPDLAGISPLGDEYYETHNRIESSFFSDSRESRLQLPAKYMREHSPTRWRHLVEQTS